MKFRVQKILPALISTIGALLFVSSCVQNQIGDEGDRQTPVVTLIPTLTMLPSPTPSPTLFSPVGLGTPMPTDLQVISVENVSNLQQIAHYNANQGQYATLLKEDGSQMLVTRAGKGELYDTKSMQVLMSWEDELTVGFGLNGSYVLVSDGSDEWLLNPTGGRTQIYTDRTIFPSGRILKYSDVSTDGSKIASGILGETKGFWELQVINTAKNSVLLSKTYQDVCTILPQFTRGGKYLVVLTDGCGSFTIFRTSDWEVQGKIPATDINGFDTSWDDSLAVILLKDEAQIWDLETAKKVRTIPGLFFLDGRYSAGVRPQEFRAIFSPDNTKLAILTIPGKNIKVWNLEDLNEVESIKSDLENMNFVRLSNDGKVKIFSEAESRINPLWKYPINWYSEFAFNANGSEIHFTTILDDGDGSKDWRNEACSITFNGESNCMTRGPRVPNNPPLSKIGTDGEFYSISLTGRLFKIWKGLDESGELIGSWTLDTDPYYLYFYRIPFLAPQFPVVYFKVDDLSLMENLKNKKVIKPERLIPHFEPFYTYRTKLASSVSKDSKKLAVLDMIQNNILIYELESLEMPSVIHAPEAGLGTAYVDPIIALSPNGKSVAFLTLELSGFVKSESTVHVNVMSRKLIIMDIDTKAISKTIYIPPGFIRSIGLGTGTNDMLLAEISAPGSYNTNDVFLLARLLPDELGEYFYSVNLKDNSYLSGMAFSPDGNLLALSSINGTILIIDASTGEVINKIDKQTPILDIAYSPDGKMIASSNGEDGIYVWGVLP